uniref:SWIM-type domain-containing protein n=1 Tax=Spongospora subterranea TaxID=70186 RepID=A0A0H5R219_9EUKA|eukprot:CRZ08263.1 hypothetical protein [Spongospora subterranea]
MERLGMPPDGWLVSVEPRNCNCQYFFKFGICVHFMHACFVTGRHVEGVPPPVERLVNRSIPVNRRRRGRIHRNVNGLGRGRGVAVPGPEPNRRNRDPVAGPGRPRLAGPALQLE